MTAITECEVLGQLSWQMNGGSVELHVTKRGAHMAPVRFAGGAGPAIEPYYISPWQGENLDLEGWWSEVPLRGDFFCMPFGQGAYEAQGEMHPAHGETSGAEWALQGSSQVGRVQSLRIALDTKVRPGHVERVYSLVQGEEMVYDCTTVHGFVGPTTMAHHAVLRAPVEDGRLMLSTSGMLFGQVSPFPAASAAAGEYQGLEIGAEFDRLECVPSIFKGHEDVDCSVWPGLRGYTDLLQIATERPEGRQPAWVAAVNAGEGYVWVALKDVRVLPSTVFWREDRGRHGMPWLGRNCALGLEDACTYFGRSIAESSASNPFSQRSVRTHHELSGDPFEIRYIQGVVRCSHQFGKVVRAEFSQREARFYDGEGRVATAAVQCGFLFGDELV